ncbi:MAG: choice-of-anchor J domain-containing protein [Prevotellaceae bacterium]|jgi:hypothetical protein|nr:choice-of-anchor J domain-containing protein [Prevotellaceae bacterium]
MRKIKTLAIYFIFAAGITSCRNDKVDSDEFIPAPTEGATSLYETFDGFTPDAKVANVRGWSELLVKGRISWIVVNKNGNKYAEITAANTTDDNDCEAWLLTPALDLAKAPNKTLTFSTQLASWREQSSLEVYLLPARSTKDAVKLAIGEAPDYIRIAQQADGPDVWVPSGDVDLSRHAGMGIVYVAFRYTAKGGTDNSTTFRIDNVALGSVGGDTGGDTTGVSTLSEDFESFTDGTGNAYMSKQPDSKGWKGLNTQGASDKLEPDVRKYGENENKFVQFSAHRNSITTAAAQEFWLISPSLNVDSAASKTFSFDVAAGYYNENTVFEVYIMDGDNPATASKEKLEWSRPSAIPPGAYGAFASSGNVDISAYSGIRRIGFYYQGTSGSGNSTTYQLDNFVFGSSVAVTPTLKFTSTASAAVVVGNELSHTFTLEEKNLTGTTTISCSDLPDWLTLTGKTLTGTAPATAGSYTLNVTAANGSVTAAQALTITVTEPVAPGSNLVVNGSFEDFADATPGGWSIGTGVNNNPVAKIAAAAQDGSFAVKLAGATGGRCDLKQTIAGIVPGATYAVSFWYKDNTQGVYNQGVKIWSNFSNGSGKPIVPDAKSRLQSDTTLAPTASWALFTLDVVAPDEAASFNFEIRATKNNEGIIDNCSFVTK